MHFIINTKDTFTPVNEVAAASKAESEEDEMEQDHDEESEGDNGFIVDDDGGGYKDELITDAQFSNYANKQRDKYASKKPRQRIFKEQTT